MVSNLRIIWKQTVRSSSGSFLTLCRRELGGAAAPTAVARATTRQWQLLLHGHALRYTAVALVGPVRTHLAGSSGVHGAVRAVVAVLRDGREQPAYGPAGHLRAVAPPCREASLSPSCGECWRLDPGNARINILCKSQSCMVSKLPIIWTAPAPTRWLAYDQAARR